MKNTTDKRHNNENKFVDKIGVGSSMTKKAAIFPV